jgi:mannosyltransferase OCH1-like enzyme
MGNGCTGTMGPSYAKLFFFWVLALIFGLLLLLTYTRTSSKVVREAQCKVQPALKQVTVCPNVTTKIVEKIVEKKIEIPGPTQKINIPGLTSNGNTFDAKKPVPKIVHYAWYSKSKLTLRFHHYVSILSALKFIKPEKIIFWYEIAPKGPYWDEIKLKINESSKLEMMHRVGPTSIYGNHINVEEHKSDVVRLEAVLKYGGIYMDLDVITLKNMDDLLKYDTTMGYELSNWLCNGFIMSKAFAPFLRMWHTEYVSFSDGHWNYHSVQLPGILAKNYPSLVHTEWDTIHRPNWQETNKIYGKGVKYDWSRNYAMHLWYRKYNKDHNKEDIKKLNSTLGEMFRYILYGKKEIIS